MDPTSIQHPTGFAPTSLPFWEALDPGGFEQFCTDLLNQHPVVPTPRGDRRILAAQRLLGGNAQGGVDIRADVEQGEVWVLSCKRVQTFGRSDVQDAIQEAEEGQPHADQFVLVTTCGLGDEARRVLDERSKWMWWDSARLTTIAQRIEPVEGGIHLVSQHFGPEVVKRVFRWGMQPYVDWHEFFKSDLESGRQFHHRTEWVAVGTALEELGRFARDGEGRAMVMSAFGGSGKSRLLLELARTLESQSGAPRVRFLNLGRRSLTEDQLEVLSREKDLMLIVDDGHRLTDTLEGVVRAACKAATLRLLVATRPHAAPALRTVLSRAGYEEKIDELREPLGWSNDELHTLAGQVLQAEFRDHVPRLVNLAGGCPLLVVLGASALAKGMPPESMTRADVFRQRVLKGFRDDFLQGIEPPRRERVVQLIRVLSFVNPVANDAELRTGVAEVLGVTPLQVADDLDSLLAGGLAVETGEGVRLYPDLFADAVLGEAVLDHGGRPSALVQAVLDRLSFSCFPALLRNLGQVDWEVRGRCDGVEMESPFEPIWNAFLERLDRAEGWERLGLLERWAPIAAYQPERTLDLAEWMHRSPALASESKADFDRLLDRLPVLLEPIVVWHPGHAFRALDLLWTLSVRPMDRSRSPESDPAGAIARAAAFQFLKPPSASDSVISWLERRLRSPEGQRQVDECPGLLSVVLKPFFARESERQWPSGEKVVLQWHALSPEKTRGIRERALRLAGEFLLGSTGSLALGVLPVFREAMVPIRFRGEGRAQPEDHVTWRPDRMAALGWIERAIARFRDEPTLLLTLRRSLHDRRQYEPDSEFRKEVERVFASIPDDFELRCLRVMSSYPHDEECFGEPGDVAAALERWEKRWPAFCAEVAGDAVERWGEARGVLEEIQRRVGWLEAAGANVRAEVMLEAVAGISAAWAETMLREIIDTRESGLDKHSVGVWRMAHRLAPRAYEECMMALPERGRPEIFGAWMFFVGGRQHHEAGLSTNERQVIESMATRAASEVVPEFARILGLHFVHDANWAAGVLARLPVEDGVTFEAGVEALALLCRNPPTDLDPDRVAECLRRWRGRGPRHLSNIDHRIGEIGVVYPKELYGALRDAPEDDGWRSLGARWWWDGIVPLGRIEDEDFVNREVEAQWKAALAAAPESARRNSRLALIRSLLLASSKSVPEVYRQLMEDCRTADSLVTLVALVAPRGARIALEAPDLMRAILERATSLGICEEARGRMMESVLGGAFGFVDGEPDPETRNMLATATDLATRFRDDALLGPLYSAIQDAEGAAQKDLRSRVRRRSVGRHTPK